MDYSLNMFRAVLLVAAIAVGSHGLASAAPAPLDDFSAADLCVLSGKCGRAGEPSPSNLGPAFGCAMVVASAWWRRRKA